MINHIIQRYNLMKNINEKNLLKEIIEKEGYSLHPLIFHIEFYNMVKFLNYKVLTDNQLKNIVNKMVCNIFQFTDVESVYLYDYLNDFIYQYLIGFEVYTLDYEHYYEEMLESISLFISSEDLQFIIAFEDIKDQLYRPLSMTVRFKDGKFIKTKGEV